MPSLRQPNYACSIVQSACVAEHHSPGRAGGGQWLPASPSGDARIT
ncbi:hypothetical protein DLM_1334 [Aquitalea magnusonii]|uniref:Uncharacterized protein n=1 Tax=Aquitalea magnusonii TaxID=332411 RepID=A0A3G9GAN7_9NEIS|nr:hypothetical protein [Aquitalea magnusonii]BBF84958.1 hypothetical protein DLM_1334 [Aquitalea magnusonii]